MKTAWAVLRERIRKRSNISEDGCWIWSGSLDCSGYARIFVDHRNWRASQITWAARNEQEWPQGKFALHSCDNRKCVNPNHIRPGSNSENVKEAWDRGGLRKYRFKRQCSRGHLMTPDNVVKFQSTGNLRHCRACIKAKSLISNARAKQRRQERKLAS